MIKKYEILIYITTTDINTVQNLPKMLKEHPQVRNCAFTLIETKDMKPSSIIKKLKEHALNE